MSKRKKILLVIFVVLLLSAGSWLYWETELPLSDILPEEDWTKMEFAVGTPGVEEVGIQPPALEKVLAAIAETKVIRASKSSGMTDPYFRLTLFTGDSYPTLIYVVENGRVTIAVELDFDHYQYYEGGEELYQALLALTNLEENGAA